MMKSDSGSIRWVQLGVLVALSALGAYIKLGPWSIAFDAVSGFLAALALGPGAGALVCGLGHLTAAGATGFPLTLPFHLTVALVMGVVGATGGYVARHTSAGMGVITLVFANGVAAPAVLSYLPNPMGTGLFAALVLPLSLAATANALAAWLVLVGLNRAGWLR